MKRDLGEKGFVKTVLLLAIFVLLIVIGFIFAGPYYRYYTLASHTRDVLRQEIGNIEVIKKKIIEDAVQLKVPLDEQRLEVKINEKVVKVKGSWTENVDLWGIYQTKVDFTMEEEL